MKSQLCRGRASVFLKRRFYSPSPVATTIKGPQTFVPTIFSHHFVSPIRCRGLLPPKIQGSWGTKPALLAISGI